MKILDLIPGFFMCAGGTVGWVLGSKIGIKTGIFCSIMGIPLGLILGLLITVRLMQSHERQETKPKP